MTVLSPPARQEAVHAAPARLRTLLLVDGVGTATLGVVALAAAEPLSDLVGTPTVLRLVGALFVLVGVDMLLARRLSGRRMRLAAVVLGEADLVFAVGTVAAVLALGASTGGTALVAAVAAVCVGMGIAKLRLAQALAQR